MTWFPVPLKFILQSPVRFLISIAMLVLAVLVLLPALSTFSGDVGGNIRILEEEVAAAIKACTNVRQRRSDENSENDPNMPRIDGNSRWESNQYNHERRNTTGTREQIHVLNATDYDYTGYGTRTAGDKYVNSVPRPALGNSYNESSSAVNRTRRSDPLVSKGDVDQCLSQCVFANLQVVDTRGIPREAELWNKVQASVTSQQSRSALRDQIRACFQELQSEAEDNGCSYSNKLERCLMLRFSHRKSPKEDGQGSQKT